MAGGDEFSGGLNGSGALAGLLFIGAGTNVYDAFSAVMSSPWSTRKFTKDSEDAKLARNYVRHAIIISWIYAIGGALLAYQTKPKLAIWPIVGAFIVTVYMWALYNQAVSPAEDGSSCESGD